MIKEISDKLVEMYMPDRKAVWISDTEFDEVDPDLIPEYDRRWAEFDKRRWEDLDAKGEWYDVEMRYPNGDITKDRFYLGKTPDIDYIRMDLADDAMTYMYHHDMSEDVSQVEFRIILANGTSTDWQKIE